MPLIALYIIGFLAVTLVCVNAGLLWKAYQQRKADRADMDARDAWANDYIERHKHSKGEAA